MKVQALFKGSGSAKAAPAKKALKSASKVRTQISPWLRPGTQRTGPHGSRDLLEGRTAFVVCSLVLAIGPGSNGRTSGELWASRSLQMAPCRRSQPVAAPNERLATSVSPIGRALVFPARSDSPRVVRCWRPSPIGALLRRSRAVPARAGSAALRAATWPSGMVSGLEGLDGFSVRS